MVRFAGSGENAMGAHHTVVLKNTGEAVAVDLPASPCGAGPLLLFQLRLCSAALPCARVCVFVHRLNSMCEELGVTGCGLFALKARVAGAFG